MSMATSLVKMGNIIINHYKQTPYTIKGYCRSLDLYTGDYDLGD